MSRHFTATVLLARPWPLAIDALAQAVRARFPAIGRIEALPGQAGAGDTGVLTVDGAQVVVQSMARPAPADELRPPLGTVRVWDAEPAIRAHRARLSVSCGGSLPGLVAAEAYAAATHFVAAAAAGLAPASAVLWQHGWTVSRPRDFIDACAGLMRGRMPVGIWVGFAPVAPRGWRPEEATGVLTYGLRPLIGREIELAPRPCDVARAHACLAGLVRRLLDTGEELRDGMTVEAPHAPPLVVRARTYWLRRNASAFVLVAADSVVDRVTLRPRQRRAA